MMRKAALLAMFLLSGLLAWASPAQPGKPGNFGLGVMIGEPTGVAAKLWLGSTSAIDGVLAWSFAGNPALEIHADYLIHFFDLIRVEQGRLPLYLGIGASVSLGPEPEFGARFPLGGAYHFDSFPLDIFLEVGPIFLLVPGTSFDFSGGAGFRYYFPARGKAKK